jgi:CheY-like chemotaxis protein/curved DNA-binding protein CbpA
MSTVSGRMHILLVDDDPDRNRSITESLRLRGYQVHCHAKPAEALKALENLDCHLALLDIDLPGSNGLKLCRELRSLPRHGGLPIILMSVDPEQIEPILSACRQHGATDGLIKPFPLHFLLQKVESLISTPPTATQTNRCCLAGDLSQTGLPVLLHNLYSQQATGLLRLENKEVKKVIYIRNGSPIFVRSNLVKEFLGQMLVRSGDLSENDLQKSLEAARKSGQRHGLTLLEMGVLTSQQLNDILRRQCVEKLLDIFTWPGGQYHFIQAREFKQGVTSINLSPANLILQGLRDYTSRALLIRLLEPHLDHYLKRAEHPLYNVQEIHFSADEQRILDTCRGQATLREVLDQHLMSRSEAEPLLAFLLTTGILIGSDQPETTASGQDCRDQQGHQLRRESFLKDYAWMMEQDYFTLLGVNESDSRAQVRKSFHRMVKKYHPDRFLDKEVLLDLEDRVNTLFQRISDAYETLSDVTAKAHYNSVRNGTANHSSTTSLETILESEMAFQKGMGLLRMRKYCAAQKAFAEALERNPNEGEYLMYQAWTAYKSDSKSAEVAMNSRSNLIRAVELNPRLSLAHLYLGYICKDEGNDHEAQRRFERAIQCDPNCTEALRELRLMKMRKGKTRSKNKGVFGKIFS